MITSACNSPTEILSQCIAFYLDPRMDPLPHFLRRLISYDSSILIQTDQPIIIHCSWDREAMYPNIENELGLTVCAD